MPEYNITFYFKDILDGETTRSFDGTFADDATAAAAVAAFKADMAAATKSRIYKWVTKKVETDATAPAANTLVFNTVSATVNLDGKTAKGNISIPDPVDAIMAGNSLISTDLIWTSLVANIATGTGWTISDGDTYASTVAGKRVIDRSGKTNLPN